MPSPPKHLEIGIGIRIGKTIDEWVQSSTWFSTLRTLADEPRQLDSYLTSIGLQIAVHHLLAHHTSEDARVIADAAAMPYFVRYFQPSEQQLAADALTAATRMQRAMVGDCGFCSTSVDWCRYVDDTIWAFVCEDADGRWREHRLTNLTVELAFLERVLAKIVSAEGR